MDTRGNPDKPAEANPHTHTITERRVMLADRLRPMVIDGHPDKRIIPGMENRPPLSDDTVRLMLEGFDSIMKGYAEMHEMQKAATQPHIHRYDARRTVPALALQGALANCEQVQHYVNTAIDKGILAPEKRAAAVNDIAGSMTGTVIAAAIRTAHAIGLRSVSIPRDYVPGNW